MAVAVLLVLDLFPPTWVGVGLYLVVLVGGGGWVVHASRSRTWGLAHVTALAVAAVVERVTIGFLAPLPPGVDPVEKVLQSVALLGLVAAASVLAWRRAGSSASRLQPAGTVR